MRLNLALRDLHENGKPGPIEPAVRFENQVYRDSAVLLDNSCFVDCEFYNCRLWYAGGPCDFQNCQLDSETALRLTGSAARGHALWERLRKPQPSDWTPEDSEGV